MQLLKLGRLLHVAASESEQHGRVLRRIAQAALAANDHRIAAETCQRLVSLAYAPCWLECTALAQAEQFTDVKVK